MNVSGENFLRCADQCLIDPSWIILFKCDPELVAYLSVLGETGRLVFQLSMMSILKYISQGPHPVAMFEVNVFDPHQTGTLFSFLAVNRGPCS